MKSAPLSDLLATLLVSAATALAAAPALASDAAVPCAAPQALTGAQTNGPRTRAEVKAELAEARATGELREDPNAPDYPPQFATGGYTVPRVQIMPRRAAAPATDLALN